MIELVLKKLKDTIREEMLVEIISLSSVPPKKINYSLPISLSTFLSSLFLGSLLQSLSACYLSQIS
jgi:hypothetical protein